MNAKIKLTKPQETLLRECSDYTLTECNCKLLRLGGSGYSPCRFNRASILKLQRAGLIEDGSIYKITKAGRKHLEEME